MSLLSSEFISENIQVKNDINPLRVYLDPDQLMQIFMNVLLNAKHAIKGKEGRIFIASTRIQDQGSNSKFQEIITIKDNGVGIPEKAINRLFDPFVSLSGKGTGLGLSIVYALSKQNDINIDISNRKSRGVKVVLSFSCEGDTYEGKHS